MHRRPGSARRQTPTSRQPTRAFSCQAGVLIKRHPSGPTFSNIQAFLDRIRSHAVGPTSSKADIHAGAVGHVATNGGKGGWIVWSATQFPRPSPHAAPSSAITKSPPPISADLQHTTLLAQGQFRQFGRRVVSFRAGRGPGRPPQCPHPLSNCLKPV